MPSRIRLVSRARPASVIQASVGPGGRSVAHRQVVVGAEERVEAGVLGGPGDGAAGRRTRALLGFGEDAQIHGESTGKAPTLARRQRRPSGRSLAT